MAERMSGWRANDGTELPTKAEAERHDARCAIHGFFACVIEECAGDEDFAAAIVEAIERDPDGFRELLRGLVPLRRAPQGE